MADHGANQESVKFFTITAPTLTAPAANANVFNGIALTVSATSNDGDSVMRLDWVLDPGSGEVAIASDSTPPYSVGWTPTGITDGAHTLVARTVYANGQHIDSAPITINVGEVLHTLAPSVTTLRAYQSDFGVHDAGGGVSDSWTDQKNSVPATQATGGIQPAIITNATGTRTALRFGSGRFLKDATLNLPAPGTTPLFVMFVAKQNSWTTGKAGIAFGTAGAPITIGQQWATSGSLTANAALVGPQNNGAAVGQLFLGQAQYSNSAGDFLTVGSSTTFLNVGNTDPAASFTMGALADGTAGMDLDLYDVTVFNARPTNAELLAFKNAVSAMYSGVVVGTAGDGFADADFYTLDMTKVWDAPTQTPLTTSTGISYTQREGFARYIIQTNASQILVHGLTDTLGFPGLPGYNSTGILVNGTPQGDGLQLGAQGTVAHTIYSLPAGTNTITLVDGPNVGREPAVQQVRGTPNIFYALPHGSSHSIVAPTAPAKRIVLLNDSIIEGYGLTDEPNRSTAYQCPGVLMRKNALASSSGTFAGAAVMVAGMSGRRFADEASSAGLRTASVNRLITQLDGTSSNLLIVELGENDYGNGVTVANYQADAGSWADAVHAQFPTLQIILVSLLIGNETATFGGGGTRPQYRTALSTVQSTRTSFCKYIDGLTLIPSLSGTYFYADFTHLNTVGQATYEVNLRAALNAISLGY